MEWDHLVSWETMVAPPLVPRLAAALEADHAPRHLPLEEADADEAI